MAAATDIQMQTFADTRIRVHAEALRNIAAALADDANNIGDEYARAVSNSAWADGRGDGPPHLLQSGNSANPDDFLNFNALAVLFGKFVNGTFASQAEANSAAAMWTVLMRACVNPVQS